MRIFAFLLLCLSMSAFQGRETISPDALQLAAAPNGQAANILFESADGGQTWQDLSPGLPANLKVHCIFAQNGELFLGAENGGVYHSLRPESGFWEREELSLAFPSETVGSIFPGQSGPYANALEGGFFQKIAGTNLWRPMHEALQDKRVYAVAENPDGSIVIGCDSGIYKSVDGGKTWKYIFIEGWATNLVAAGGVLLCNGAEGLLRSTDGGEHWDCVLPDKGGYYTASVIKGGFAALRVAGPWRTAAEAAPLRTSADGGKTWQPLDDVPFPAGGIYELVQAGEYLFCSHENGISRSGDGGASWELVRPFSDPDKMTRLTLAVSGNTVYAVIVRAGC